MGQRCRSLNRSGIRQGTKRAGTVVVSFDLDCSQPGHIALVHGATPFALPAVCGYDANPEPNYNPKITESAAHSDSSADITLSPSSLPHPLKSPGLIVSPSHSLPLSPWRTGLLA